MCIIHFYLGGKVVKLIFAGKSFHDGNGYVRLLFVAPVERGMVTGCSRPERVVQRVGVICIGMRNIFHLFR